MKKLFLILALITSVTKAQVVGKQYPDLVGETYDDKKVLLPNDIQGKYSLIGMAYSKDSELALRTWFDPVYNKFIAKSGIVDYDLNIFFVPMFTGTNELTAGVAKKKLKEGTDKEFWPYVIFYQGSLKKYKDELAFEKKDIPYIFVLDKNGKIVYATSGSFSEQKLEEIEDKLE